MNIEVKEKYSEKKNQIPNQLAHLNIKYSLKECITKVVYFEENIR